VTLSGTLERLRDLAQALGRPVRLMEVCGTHTMAAFRSGLRSLLPPGVSLLSGPGCPVCVTPTSFVDHAIAIARQPGVCVATFGDLLRVPGTESSLERARAQGAEVRIVYSPLEALRLATGEPSTQVVFLGVGFETTAPAVAWTVREACRRGVAGYSVLCAHKTMPQAMAALLAGGEIGIDGFLCPGHVSTITGAAMYEPICRQYAIPCVIAGFEPADMAEGLAMLLSQCLEGRAAVEIQYHRCVTRHGNAAALGAIAEVFEPCDVEWRGLGLIAGSGLKLRDAFGACDAAPRFPSVSVPPSREPDGCACGDVLRGVRTPLDCPLFRTACTPGSPVGACMVSSEGTCAAYYRYAAR
jgi:hydrogenase expression/formation protein HypD